MTPHVTNFFDVQHVCLEKGYELKERTRRKEWNVLLFVVVLVLTNIRSDGKKANPREPDAKITRKVVILYQISKKKWNSDCEKKNSTKKTFNTNINIVKDNFKWSSTIKCNPKNTILEPGWIDVMFCMATHALNRWFWCMDAIFDLRFQVFCWACYCDEHFLSMDQTNCNEWMMLPAPCRIVSESLER